MLYCNKDSEVCEHIKMKIIVLLLGKILARSVEDRLYLHLLFHFVFSALVDYLKSQLREFGQLTLFLLHLIVFRGR